MEIRTKAYGLMDINPEEIITFDYGLIGFEDLRQFVLLGNENKDVLLWLQSVEEEHLAFVVIQPRLFRPDYQPQIHLNELAGLDIDGDEQKDLLIYSIVVVPEDIKKMTANLQAPLVINTKKKKAKQIILNDDTYKIKEYIFADN